MDPRHARQEDRGQGQGQGEGHEDPGPENPESPENPENPENPESQDPRAPQLAGWQRALMAPPDRATSVLALIVGVVCVGALLVGMFTLPPGDPGEPAREPSAEFENAVADDPPGLVLDPPPAPDATRDQLLARDRAQRAELAELRAEVRRLRQALQAARDASE